MMKNPRRPARRRQMLQLVASVAVIFCVATNLAWYKKVHTSIFWLRSYYDMKDDDPASHLIPLLLQKGIADDSSGPTDKVDDDPTLPDFGWTIEAFQRRGSKPRRHQETVPKADSETDDRLMQRIPPVAANKTTTTVSVTASSHQDDRLCPYCRLLHYSSVRLTLLCHNKILQKLQTEEENWDNEKYSNAAVAVATEHPDVCGRCDPAACNDDDKRYYRVDRVAPKVHGSVTHFLESVPSKHRVRAQDVPKLGTPQWVDIPEREYPVLWEFNPSLVQLPADQITDPRRDVYLAAFRVSRKQSCLTPGAEADRMNGNNDIMLQGPPNYLGLAVLDEDLRIVREMVVEQSLVENILHFEDPRLFVLHGQMYLGSFSSLLPIWLNHPPDDSQTDLIVFQHAWPEEENTMTLTTAKTAFCSKSPHIRKSGKNLNYFVDNNNRTILEQYPMQLYEEIDLNRPCTPEFQFEHNSDDPESYGRIRPNTTVSNRIPSFGTTDELQLGQKRHLSNPYTGESGGICCTNVEWQGQKLLLGISHSKTPFRHRESVRNVSLPSNHFFSSFYVLEAHPPYNVVARTGRFCFGSETNNNGSQNKNNHNNPHIVIPLSPLYIVNEIYDCPKVHFVSGMQISAKDPSKLIVSYGVNDCLPRMVLIELDDVMRLLFNPHHSASAAE